MGIMQRNIISLLLFPILLVGACLLFLSLSSQASPASDPSSLLFQDNSDEPITAVSNTSQGEAAVYQTIYTSSRTDSNNKVTWIGGLHAQFMDIFGNLRPLWDAGKQLSSLENVTTQRRYNASADTGRYIFTYLDLNGDGLVDDAEVMDFLPSSFGAGRYGILDVADIESAQTLVNYIRGNESQNSSKHLRNRTLDVDGNGDVEVMRLGDIVHSSAMEVGAPAEAFDLLYGDSTYGRFRSQYAERRKVVYVGANDGMLHAFNAGFYKAKNRSYESQGYGNETQHPLGSELWAYIPYNLLSQLKALQSPDYNHVWYVDGKPRIFDAKIFAEDKTHPGGWGTILAIGMHFGGSQTRLNMKENAAGFSAFTSQKIAATIIQQQSAYVLIDITDPEQKPTLIAEVTDPSGSIGYTTSQPTVATFTTASSKASDPKNQWYLVFGSGPALASTDKPIPTTTIATAKLFVYDLVRKQFVQSGNNSYLYDLGEGASESFVGDPVVVDWNLNYKADALYFGTVGGNENTPSGKLFKLDFNESSASEKWIAPTVLVDPKNPVIAAPAVTKDEHGNHWLVAGTGRIYSAADMRSVQTQSLFAALDTLPAQTPDYGNFVEASDASARRANSPSEVTSQSALEKLVQDRKGWKRSLKQASDSAAERSITQIALLGGTLFATTFIPDSTGDIKNGKSRLYCLNYRTGTTDTSSPNCNAGASTIARSSSVTSDAVDLGPGLATSPVLNINGTADSSLSVLIQTSAGTVTQNNVHASQNVRSGEIDWREIHQ